MNSEPTQPHCSVGFDALCDVTPVPIEWLWEPHIALGKLTVIAGQPGLGKSQLTVSLASHVSTGSSWPFATGRAQQGNVVFITAEDDAADTIVPRLIAAEADLQYIKQIRNKTVDVEDRTGMLDIASNIADIEQVVKSIGSVRLLVIDPISAYLGNTDQNSNGEIRGALFPVQELASRNNIAVIAVSHLNKKSGQDAMSRVSGSGGLVAAARAMYLVTRNPQDPDGPRLFLPGKNNVGDDSNGYEYKIESATVKQSIKTSRIVWTGKTSLRADDVVDHRPSESGGKVDEAKQLILEEFNDHQHLPAARLLEVGKAKGISNASMNRAKTDLGFVSDKDPGFWRWSRPKNSTDTGVKT